MRSKEKIHFKDLFKSPFSIFLGQQYCYSNKTRTQEKKNTFPFLYSFLPSHLPVFTTHSTKKTKAKLKRKGKKKKKNVNHLKLKSL